MFNSIQPLVKFFKAHDIEYTKVGSNEIKLPKFISISIQSLLSKVSTRPRYKFEWEHDSEGAIVVRGKI